MGIMIVESVSTGMHIEEQVVWSVEEMRSADAATIENIERRGECREGSSPSFELMRRAGEAVARVIAEEVTANDLVLVLVGPGNNGGDGLVVARALREAGVEVRVIVAEGSTKTAEWEEAAEAWRAIGGEFYRVGQSQNAAEDSFSLSEDRAIDAEFKGATIVIDALLGIGQRGSPRGSIARLIGAIKRRKMMVDSPFRVVAVDIPTGVCADSGRVFDPWVTAHETISIQGIKRGCLLAPAYQVCGALRAVDVGINGVQKPRSTAVVPHEERVKIPWAPNAHKFDRGRVVIIGGEISMPGAPALVSESALRVGAGLVVQCRTAEMDQSLIRPEIIRAEIGSGGRFELQHYERLMEIVSTASAVVIGPGIGRAEGTGKLIKLLLASMAEHDPATPIIIDADALSLIAEGELTARLFIEKKRWILTPHHGEAARLLGITAQKVVEQPFVAAQDIARRFLCTVVLKGAGTIIADGENFWVIPPAAIGLATAGSGDVLAGIIGGLSAQARAREQREESLPRALEHIAIEGVMIHGLAALSLGERGFIAHDLVEAISDVVSPVVDSRYYAQ